MKEEKNMKEAKKANEIITKMRRKYLGSVNKKK